MAATPINQRAVLLKGLNAGDPCEFGLLPNISTDAGNGLTAGTDGGLLLANPTTAKPAPTCGDQVRIYDNTGAPTGEFAHISPQITLTTPLVVDSVSRVIGVSDGTFAVDPLVNLNQSYDVDNLITRCADHNTAIIGFRHLQSVNRNAAGVFDSGLSITTGSTVNVGGRIFVFAHKENVESTLVNYAFFDVPLNAAGEFTATWEDGRVGSVLDAGTNYSSSLQLIIYGTKYSEVG